MSEIFELELLGGGVEKRYRAERPHAEPMPWGTLDVSSLSQEERAAAQRGWTDLALEEYGAAASQSNVARLVMRARAPLDLSAMIASFPLDELLHTELCARMASELGGAAAIAYEPQHVFPAPESNGQGALLEAATAVAWEYCVGETLSHGLLTYHRRRVRHPLLRAVWGRLAKDEAVHARFGWLFLDWAAPLLTNDERAEVARTAQRAIAHARALDDKVRGLPAAAFVTEGVFGADRARYLEEANALLEARVVPRLEALGVTES